jgi:hypothetical protein
MKSKFSIKNYLPFMILLLLIAASVNAAAYMYDVYKSIAKGLLACAFLFLEYRIYLSQQAIVADPVRTLFEYPSGFRYLGLGLSLSFLNYWALSQVVDMVVYIIKLLRV